MTGTDLQRLEKLQTALLKLSGDTGLGWQLNASIFKPPLNSQIFVSSAVRKAYD